MSLLIADKSSCKMKIEFLTKEKTLLRTDYIKLIRHKSLDKIIIKKNDIKLINLQFGEIFKEYLIIRVIFRGR